MSRYIFHFVLAIWALMSVAVAEPVRRTVTVTPTVDTSIYASGDQIGTLFTITGALKLFQSGLLESVTVVDKSKQKSAINIILFNQSTAVASADNAALDITDALMATNSLGYVPVAAADYKDLNANSIATVRGLNLSVSSTGDNLYGIILSGGTPTYTSASELVITFGFLVGQ